MKVTVVPAQVTTVEDRIMGSLSFSQMMLLVVPVFVCAGLFAALPPFMGSAPYKYTLMGMLASVCCVLAIRIRGKIVALWLLTIVRYNLRPTYYLFNKNVTAFRVDYTTPIPERETKKKAAGTQLKHIVPKLDVHETAKVLAAIEHPAAHFRFEKTRKGGLHVRLTEVKE